MIWWILGILTYLCVGGLAAKIAVSQVRKEDPLEIVLFATTFWPLFALAGILAFIFWVPYKVVDIAWHFLCSSQTQTPDGIDSEGKPYKENA